MRFVDSQIRSCYTRTSGKGDKSPIEPLKEMKGEVEDEERKQSEFSRRKADG